MISINCQGGSTILFHEIKLLRTNPFHLVEHEKLLDYKLYIKFRKKTMNLTLIFNNINMDTKKN